MFIHVIEYAQNLQIFKRTYSNNSVKGIDTRELQIKRHAYGKNSIASCVGIEPGLVKTSEL